MPSSPIAPNTVLRHFALCIPLAALLSAGCSAEQPADATDERVGTASAALSTTSVTEAGDDLRTGHYPNQARLSPSVVSGSTFGQLFSVTVNGQVYAQPLVSQGTLFVVTETNDVYGLDPESGAERWHRNLGTPFDPTAAPIGCNDLTPRIGVTGTPVVDRATNTAYLFSKVVEGGVTKTLAHGIDVATGLEKTGFPVTIQGAASNAPAVTFDATHHLQRPGLLLMGGMVYAAFGGHCDAGPWQGWLVGVSTDGARQTRWVANRNGDNGAGIWQSGAGIMSDGAGRMFVATGNGGAQIGPIVGSQAANLQGLGEAIVRVDVQANGSLQAADFFSPYDAQALDSWDADFASGGPVALPDSFGTSAFPHLLVAVGKQGYVYLLNRDNLGGIGTGPGQGDAVVFRSDANGGVWSKPAVWPGDGGYVYIPTASGGNAAGGSTGFFIAYKAGRSVDGKPTLNKVGQTPDAFGFSSSRPIVTSDGLTSGTAIVWIVWSPGGEGSGSELRAYSAVPNAAGQLEVLFRSPIGRSSKFNPPGVGDGRVYVGTREGHVLGFGSPVTPVLNATPLQFGNVTVGGTATANVTITAAQALTIQSVTVSSPEFVAGTPAASSLAQGATTTLPVSFKPTSSGLKGASLIITTDKGSASTSLSGKALAASAELSVAPPVVSFGGTTVGGTLTQQLVLTNTGATALTLSGFTPPAAPFSVAQLPATGTSLPSDTSLALQVRFAPSALGDYQSTFTIQSSAGPKSILLTGKCATAGHLQISPLDLDFGRVATSATRWAAFTVANTGGVPLTITKSKPPVLGPFTAASELSEGTVLAAAESRLLWVKYTPPSDGVQSDVWTLNSSGDNGLQDVALHGTGASGIASLAGSGWQLNGSASSSGEQITLTQAHVNYTAGSAFWKTPLPSNALDVSFDATLGGGEGADGMALVLADAASQAPTALGADGGGLGFAGVRGIALALDTYFNEGEPSANFIGFARSPASGQAGGYDWLTTKALDSPLRSDLPILHHVRFYVANPGVTPSVLVAQIDGVEVLRTTQLLPASVYVGFSAGNGGYTDLHAVSGVSIVSQPPPSQNGSGAVLGFENVSQWLVSAGTVTTSAQTTQGSAALGVAGFYYTELTSTPLSTLTTVGSTASVDLRPPTALTYGQAQLYIDAPSVGVHMAYIGQVNLAGSAANAFRTISFNVPASVVTALRGTYADLRLKLTLNAPSSSQPYVLDNFRFSGG